MGLLVTKKTDKLISTLKDQKAQITFKQGGENNFCLAALG